MLPWTPFWFHSSSLSLAHLLIPLACFDSQQNDAIIHHLKLFCTMMTPAAPPFPRLGANLDDDQTPEPVVSS
jgi:hypothetical protein